MGILAFKAWKTDRTHGHINPLITFSTLIVGLTGFSRGISAIHMRYRKERSPTTSAMLYMSGQLLGAGLAGGVLRGAFGADRSIESVTSRLSVSRL